MVVIPVLKLMMRSRRKTMSETLLKRTHLEEGASFLMPLRQIHYGNKERKPLFELHSEWEIVFWNIKQIWKFCYEV